MRHAQPADDPRQVADALLAETRALAADWRRLDPEAYLAHFSDDLVFYFQGVNVPRADFEAVVRGSMQSLRASTFEISDPDIEVLGETAGVLTFSLREEMIDRQGNRTDLRAMLTLVYEYRDGEWVIVRAHESLLMPAEGSP